MKLPIFHGNFIDFKRTHWWFPLKCLFEHKHTLFILKLINISKWQVRLYWVIAGLGIKSTLLAFPFLTFNLFQNQWGRFCDRIALLGKVPTNLQILSFLNIYSIIVLLVGLSVSYELIKACRLVQTHTYIHTQR